MRKYFLLILVFVNIVIWNSAEATQAGLLKVAFLDVGQGDAVLIESPSGNQMLIDSGVGRGILRELGDELSFSDDTIDVILATHPDKDHIGGLPDVLEKYETYFFIESEAESNTGTYLSLQELVEHKEIQKVLARSGMIIDFRDGVYLRIFFPDRSTFGMEANTASIITQLVYGDIEFMLTGDSPKSIEEYVVSRYGHALESDVLKVGHHGSKTSSSQRFVETVSPKYAVISAGKDNRYGHPSKEVLDLFEAFGAETINTADAGTIVFETDGENLTLK